jgi:UDP-N-acetylglucosamine acyltransferase
MTRIHPTAVVDPSARLGEGVEIGPYCVVGPEAALGDSVRLLSHVVVERHTALGARCTVHPFARLGGLTQDLKYKGGTPRAEIGPDTVIRECVTVNTATNDGDATRVGARCLIMAYAHVAHDCVIGDEVIMANNATLAGHVIVEPQAIIGGLSAVHQFVRIGRMSMIGGMCRVLQDVPPFMLASDTPMRVVTTNAIGLRRRGVSDEVQQTLKKAHRLIYRSRLRLEEAIARIGAELPPSPELAHLTAFLRGSQRGIAR